MTRESYDRLLGKGRVVTLIGGPMAGQYYASYGIRCDRVWGCGEHDHHLYGPGATPDEFVFVRSLSDSEWAEWK